MAKYIDIDRVFREKNPSMYRWTPKFAIDFMKKLIHEEDLNRFMELNKDKYREDFLNEIIKEMDPTIIYQGLENIPDEGGAIVVSNHPLGGLDGVALLQVITKKRKDAKFLVNDILMNLTNFGDMFVPVNKMGKNSSEYRMGIEEAFQSDGVVIIFPAGLVSRRSGGVVRDLQWQKGFVTRAVRYQRDIYPTYIEGKLTDRFYNLSNLRKRLGIKVNIELVLLPDETYKQKNQSIDITIGKKVSYEILDFKRHTAEAWADIFRDFVYTMKDNPEADFEKYLEENNL